MNHKIFKALLIISILTLSFSLNPVSAKNFDKNSGDIPEEDGIYDVAGHPDLKVRVFVHKVHGKPTPSPTLICDLADNNSLAVVDPAGWKLPTTWSYNLNPNNVPTSVGGENLSTIANNSFKVWTDAVNNQISINRGADTTLSNKGLDGKNIITWGIASGSALGVTYIWYNPATREVAEVDTILNKKFFWKWSNSSTCAYTESYDAQNILTHELGHWLGLDDEYTSAYTNNTMYGYGAKAEVKKNTLTTGDINGVKAIY